MAYIPELISNLEQSLERGTEGGELVEYSIFNNSSAPEGYGSTLEIGYYDNTIYAHNHQSHHEVFIRSIFESLDPFLDLDFVEGDSSGGSDINIHRSWYNSYYDEIDLLDNKPSAGWGGGTAHYDLDHIDISWKDHYADDPFTAAEKYTIVHEIGHALGLDDLAFDPRWDTYDSMMSYNHPSELPLNTWFTQNDINAMQSIWGVEDDHKSSFEGTSSGDHFKGTNKNDFIAGFDGDDKLKGGKGWDTVLGNSGDDVIYAGIGRDYIWGGSGADDVHGGFGHNTFGDERDGSVDSLSFKSDQFAYNWLYGKTGNNATGQKVDVIKGLDLFDRLFVQGVKTSELSFEEVNKLSAPSGNFSGIGIFANGFLEGLYIGGDLSAAQLQSMTTGVDI